MHDHHMPCPADTPAGIHVVVQAQCEQITQAELLIHHKVLARCLHEHLPVPVTHGWVMQILQITRVARVSKSTPASSITAWQARPVLLCTRSCQLLKQPQAD
jgi:hypothetical protein